MTSTTADLLSAYWGRQLAALEDGLAAVRTGDLLAVHRSRVAIRRLRSTLRTFGDLFDQDLTGGLDPQLRWLAVELGEVRDRQVLRELFCTWPDADEVLRTQLALRLDREIAAAGARVSVLVAGPRTTQVVEQVTAIATVRPRDGDDVAFRARASRQVTRRFRRAEAEQPDPVRMHAVRKAVKRARYAAEVVAEDESARQDVLRFEELQEVLGLHQDLALAGSYLRAAGEDDPTLSGAASARWLAELTAGEAAAGRDAFVVAAATVTVPSAK